MPICRRRLARWILCVAPLSFVSGQSCITFPANLIPFSSINYVTAANAAGDQLVVGTLAGGLNTLSQIPVASTGDQLFCDNRVQLSAQQFYPGVYVPTAQERAGNFSSFAGLLLDPQNNQPFPGGQISASRLGAVYAFRINSVLPANLSRNWSPTGPVLAGGANEHMLTLPNGKVLRVSQLIELYDPVSGQWSSFQKSAFVHGGGATTTLLNNGKVLIVGGDNALSSAELYDPAAGTFTAMGALIVGRSAHTATLLNDGKVLIAGGLTDAAGTTSTPSAELYDPAAEKFSTTGSLNLGRQNAAATLLKDGRVLIAGGQIPGVYTDTAEIYDPVTGKFTRTGSMTCTRISGYLIPLPNGKVIAPNSCFPTSSAAVDVFDPVTGTFSQDGFLNQARALGPAMLLSSGDILIAGGFSNDGANRIHNEVELYNPTTHISTPTGSMSTPRFYHAAALLSDGRVLVTGGSGPAGGLSSSEIYTPTAQGLITSQTGVTFRAAQGSTVSQSIAVAVLSATDTIPYTVSVSTFTGGKWLSFTLSGNSVTPGNSTGLSVTANPSGLAPGDYYGTVTLTPTDGKHPPVSITAVLSIVPNGTAAAPVVSPGGLVFLTTTGSSPAAKSISVANLTSNPLSVTATLSQTTTFFTFPQSATIAAGQTLNLTVTPASATLPKGIYRGSILLRFSDGSSQTVDVLLVISAGSSNTPFERSATVCAPTKLLPVLTGLASGFSAPAAWPTPISVQVVDDCANFVTGGLVSASFTNGDPPIPLISIGNGAWGATWAPAHDSAGASVRVDAKSGALTGTVAVTGQVATNPKVPIVAVGGVLSSGDYIGTPAQGLLASIFGAALADGSLQNSSLPLPMQLGTTIVLVSGVPVPLLYVSENQVNVFIPYELAVNSPHQLTLVRGNAASVPVPVTVLDSAPAILSIAATGEGQGHIYKVDNSGAQILADAKSPASAGDVLVIYCVGLGGVNPALKSGDATPFTPLEPITGTAVVNIGGVAAKAAFAGLTPGFSGLYQINVTVPSGITPGSNVAITISVNGRASAGAVVMAIR
jgi:uncharacterized protein (TIGR03437 family)